MDFTLNIYAELISTLKNCGYSFITFQEYCTNKNGIIALDKYVILRHDVDLKSKQSVRVARIEHNIEVLSSYYFRIVKQSNVPDHIKRIVSLGHEIGYHYEDMAIKRGNIDEAYSHFIEKLNYFRSYYPVTTICMHGSPSTAYDNKDLWKKYDYKKHGIIGEPYFDTNFNEIFYLTDTGRCWDGMKYSVRDKVQTNYIQSYHSTFDIISAAKLGTLPNKIMITTHPQRWTNNKFEWLIEFISQNIKNKIKRIILKIYA